MAFEAFDPWADPEEEETLDAKKRSKQSFDEPPKQTVPAKGLPTGVESVGVPEPTSKDASRSMFSTPSQAIFGRGTREQPEKEPELLPRDLPTEEKFLSPEEIGKEARLRGTKTWDEGFLDHFFGKGWEGVPLVGSFVSAFKDFEVNQASDRLIEDNYDSERERIQDKNYVARRMNEKSIEAARPRQMVGGLDVTTIAEIVAGSTELALTFAISRGRALRGKNWLARRFSRQMPRVTKIADKYVRNKMGIRKGAKLYAKALKNTEDMLLRRAALTSFKSRTLARAGETVGRMPYMQGYAMERLFDRMGPVLEPDENGEMKLVKSQQDFITAFAKAEVETFSDSMLELMGSDLIKPFAGAWNKVAPAALAKSAVGKASKLITFRPLRGALKSPETAKALARARRVGGNVLRKTFTGRFGGDIGSLPEEFVEEWATAALASILNLDEDNNVYPDGSPKSYATRVMENLLLPITKPKESLEMGIAFALMPGVRNAPIQIIADPMSQQEARQTQSAFTKFFSGEQIKTQAEANALADEFASIAVNQDYQRWYAPLYEKVVGKKAPPRPGSAMAQLETAFSGQNLAEKYWEAEKLEPGKGGKRAIRELVDEMELHKVVDTREEADTLNELSKDGILIKGFGDYKTGLEIQERERKLQDDQAYLETAPNEKERAKLEKSIEKQQDILDALKRGKAVSARMKPSLRMRKALQEVDQPRKNELFISHEDVGGLDLSIDGPIVRNVQIMDNAADALSKPPIALEEVNTRALNAPGPRNRLISLLKAPTLGEKTEVTDLIRRHGNLRDGKMKFVLMPSREVLAKSKGQSVLTGKVWGQERARAARRPDAEGNWVVYLSLDATPRDAGEDVIESFMHENSFNDAVTQKKREQEATAFLKRMVRGRIDQGEDLEAYEQRQLTRVLNELASPNNAFEALSKMMAAHLGYRSSGKEATAANLNNDITGVYEKLAEQDPSFVDAFNKHVRGLLSPAVNLKDLRAKEGGKETAPSPAAEEAKRMEEKETPPPAAEETPPPAAEETPPPAAEETPPPAAEETPPPPPAAEETPPPAAEETPPTPAAEETPPPAAEETPPPAAEETPPPAAEDLPEATVEEFLSTEEAEVTPDTIKTEEPLEVPAVEDQEKVPPEELAKAEAGQEEMLTEDQRQEQQEQEDIDPGLEGEDNVTDSFDSDKRQDADARDFVKSLDMRYTVDNTRRALELLDASIDGLGKAIASDETWDNYLKTDAEDLKPREKKLKDRLRKLEFNRSRGTDLVTYYRSSWSPRVSMLRIDDEGSIDSAYFVTPDRAREIGNSIKGFLLDVTEDKARLKNLLTYHEKFRKSLIPASQYLATLTNEHFDPVLLEALEAYKTDKTPPGFPASAETYAAARHSFVRGHDTKYRKFLNSRRNMDTEFAAQGWVDAVTRSAFMKIRDYVNSDQTLNDLNTMRGALVDDVFLSTPETGALAKATEGKRKDPNVAWYLRYTQTESGEAPLRYFLPSGKQKNNLLEKHQLFRSLNTEEAKNAGYDDFQVLGGVHRRAQDPNAEATIEDDTGKKEKGKSLKGVVTEADADSIGDYTLEKIQKFYFKQGGDRYYMWAGAFGENKQLFFVSVPKYKRNSKATRQKLKEYDALYKRLGKELQAKGSKFTADSFMLSVAELKKIRNLMEFNYALNTPFLDAHIHGSYSEYAEKGEAGLAKRAGSTVTPGRSGAVEVMGPKINVIVVVDPTGETEAGEEVELTDGVGLMMPHWADLLQKALGYHATRQDLFPELQSAKALYSSVIDATLRNLSKFNFRRLDKAYAQHNKGGAMAAIEKQVSEYNESLPEGEREAKRIDVIYFTSAAKKHPKSKRISMFKPNSFDLVDGFNFADEVGKKLIKHNTEDLVFVQESRHLIKPHPGKTPKQRNTDLYGVVDIETDQKVQLSRIKKGYELLNDEGGFDLNAVLSLEGVPWIKGVKQGSEALSPRTEGPVLGQLAHSVNRMARSESNLIHTIELALAAPRENVPTSVLLVETGDGEYEPISYKDAVAREKETGVVPGDAVRLSRVKANVEGNYRYAEQESRPLAATVKHMKAWNTEARGYRYLDMVVHDDKFFTTNAEGLPVIDFDNAENWDYQVWELEKVDDGYRIPGEPVFVHRIPGDNPHSHTMARLVKPIPGGGNYDEMSLEDQVNSGADFDVDSRYIEVLFKRKQKLTYNNKSIWVTDFTDTTHGHQNAVLFQMLQAYQNPANYTRLKDPIKLDAYQSISKQAKEDEAKTKQPFATFARKSRLREYSRVGKQGLGITAAESAGFSYFTQLGADFKDTFVVNIPGGEGTLAVNYSGEGARNRRELAFRHIKNHIGILLNLFADNQKEDEVRHYGINEVTENLATLLMIGNADLETEDDVTNHFKRISQYLRSPLIQEYTRLMRRRKEPMVRMSSTSMWTELERSSSIGISSQAERTKAVKQLQQLVGVADDLREVFNFLRSQGEGPDNVLDFLEARGRAEAILGNQLTGVNTSRFTRNQPLVDTIMTSMENAEKFVFSKSVMVSPVGKQLLDIINNPDNRTFRSAKARKRAVNLVRTAFTLNAVYQMIPAKYRLDGPEMRAAVVKDFETWRAENPDNPLFSSLVLVPGSKKLDKGNRIQILEIMRQDNLSPENLAEIQKGFDAFFKKDPAAAARLAYYTLGRYNLSYSTWTGNFFAFVGPEMGAALNEFETRERERWNRSFGAKASAHLNRFIQTNGAFLYDPSKVVDPRPAEGDRIEAEAPVAEVPAVESKVESTETAQQEPFTVVKPGLATITGMRVKGRHLNNSKVNQPGWLGNPHTWSGNGGPKNRTQQEAYDLFKKDFLKKIDEDPAFKAAVLKLRGKKIGYYNPADPLSHLNVVKEWLAAQSEVAPAVESTETPAQMDFAEFPGKGYRERTIENAKADATIAIALDYTTAGERLTRSAAGKRYVKAPWKDMDVLNTVLRLNDLKATTLNIAGNGIYTFANQKIDQAEVDKQVYDFLAAVTSHPQLENKIISIRSGGQTGVDEAGVKAAERLGIKAIVLAPKGWVFRTAARRDISDEAQFKARFVAGTPVQAQVPETPVQAPLPSSDATASIVTSDVSPDGKISLQFNWSSRLRALPDRIKKQQTLAQQLAKIQAPKDEAAAFVKWAEGKKGDSAELLAQYESEVLPKLEIVAQKEYDSLSVDPEDTRMAYENLSVNQGQGKYKEYFIKTPFDVPGQHGGFDAPNLAGWFRAREYADGTFEIQEIQSELFQKNKGGFVAAEGTSPLRTGIEVGSIFHGVEYHGEIFAVRNTGLGYEIQAEAEGVIPNDDNLIPTAWTPAPAELILDLQRGYLAEADHFGFTPTVDSGRFPFTEPNAAFLNLMLKDQTWVPVFTDAITQWARQQGFEKVRFPTGKTAARVEGHQAIADQLKALQEEREEAVRDSKMPDRFSVGDLGLTDYVKQADGSWVKEGFYEDTPVSEAEAEEAWAHEYEQKELYGSMRTLGAIDAEIKNLKTQGIEKLAPIEAFYENRIGKMVERMGAKPATDSEGNTWRELSLEPTTPELAPLPPSFDASASVVSGIEDFVSEGRRASNLGYIMAYHDSPPGKKPTRDQIGKGHRAFRAFMEKLTAPGLTYAQRRQMVAGFKTKYSTAKYKSTLAEFLEHVKGLAPTDKKGPDARTVALGERYTPDTGIDAEEIRRYDRELGEDEDATASIVASEQFTRKARRSMFVSGELQDELIKETNENEADIWSAHAVSDVWARKIKSLAKKVKITEEIVDSALGGSVEKNEVVFNDGRPVVRNGEPVINDDKTGIRHEPIWVDVDTGRLAGEIKELKPYLSDKYPDALSVDKILTVLKNEDAELVEYLIEGQYKSQIEERRQDANTRIKGFANRENEKDGWIEKRSDYLPHMFRFVPDDLAMPTLRQLRKELGEEMAREKFGENVDLKSKEVTTFLADEATQSLIKSEAGVKYKEKMNQFHKDLEAARKEAKKGRTVETGRSSRREFATYQEAMEKTGRVPVTIRLTKSFTGWQHSVSKVILNKKYLSMLATSLDINGDLAMIAVKGKAQRGADKDTALNQRYATASLEALIPFARKIAPKEVREQIELVPGVDPWVQIERITGLIADELPNFGYEQVPMTDYNLTHVWVRAGAPKSLLTHVTSRGLEDYKDSGTIRYQTLKGIRAFNNFTKSLALAGSWFHHFALGESYSAGFGMDFKENPLTSPVHFFKAFKDLKALARSMKEHPEILAEWQRAGIKANQAAPDYDNSVLDGMLTDIGRMAGRYPLLRHTAKTGIFAIRDLKRMSDTFLWSSMLPTMKVQLAQRVLEESLTDPSLAGVPRGALMADISQYINDAFGGQQWEQYMWANPRARGLLQALIFAPDWTISALNIAGIPEIAENITGMKNPLSKRTFTNLAARQKVEKYWPAFLTLVLFGVPTMIQASIFQALGDPDDEDRRWIWDNEEGRQTYIDVTPITRALGFKWGTTNRRRAYLRWGKQAYEVKGWLTNAPSTLLSKTSMAVKTLMEQFLGKNSAWWDMPWAKQDVLGLFQVDGKFSESRTGLLLQKIVPMSVLSMMKERPSTFFAPTRLGSSKFAAAKEMTKILVAYGDKEAYEEFAKRENKQALERVVTGILDAAERNGYDREQVFNEALRNARGRLYLRVFEELGRKKGPREDKLMEFNNELQRLDGSYTALKQSMTRRFENANTKFEYGLKKTLMQSWLETQKKRRGLK